MAGGWAGGGGDGVSGCGWMGWWGGHRWARVGWLGVCAVVKCMSSPCHEPQPVASVGCTMVVHTRASSLCQAAACHTVCGAGPFLLT
jgi:hypothetical protein